MATEPPKIVAEALTVKSCPKKNSSLPELFQFPLTTTAPLKVLLPTVELKTTLAPVFSVVIPVIVIVPYPIIFVPDAQFNVPPTL